MQIKVRGHKNNRSILRTYELSDESAEAVAEDREGTFSIGAALDRELEYALIHECGEFFGMIILLSDPHRAVLSTLPRGQWMPGTRFRVHEVYAIGEQLDY